MAKKGKKDKVMEQGTFTSPRSENVMPSEEKKSTKKSKKS
jgi:hypothetical protein